MTTLYTDAFTYSNGALTTVGSPNWSTLPSDTSWNIASNVATRSATNADNCNYVSTTAVASYPNDQWGQLDDVTPAQTGNVGEGVGIALRCSTTQRTCYRLIVSSTNVNLARFNNNVYSGVVASASVTWTNGDALYAEIQGTSIIVKQNGTTILTTTDATFSTGRPGFIHSSDTTGTATADGFSAGDFGGGAAPQTVNPNAIATGEALFQPTATLKVLPNAVATGESVLQPTVKVQVLVNAIATAEQVYGPIVTLSGAPLSVLPNPVASLEAVYAPTLVQQVVAGAIATGAQVFSPSVAVVTPQTVQPGTITTAEQVYAPVFVGLVTPGVLPDAIPSAARVYAPSVAFVPRPPPPSLVRVAPVRAPALASAPHSAAPAFGSAARRTGAPPLRLGP